MPQHYRAAAKKKEGNAGKYITRSKAVKHLQVSLSTFKKLCTLKGIFPREPKKKIEGKHKTYYHKKDILLLQHDPLLQKFRVAPPHLSPFVDNEAEGYVPEYAETSLQAVAGNLVLPMPGLDDRDLDNPHNLLAEGVSDGAEANEIAEEKHKLKESDKQYQDELKMGLQGFTCSSSSSNKNLPTPTYVARHGEVTTVDLEQVAEDASNLSKVSMPRKKRKLWVSFEFRFERRKKKAKIHNKVPPPPLSPFVDNEAEDYVPEYAETIKRLQAAASNQVLPMPGLDDRDLDNPHNLLAEGVIDRAEANEIAENKRKLKVFEKQYQDELKMELQGVTYSSSSSNKNLPASTDVARHEEDIIIDLEQVAKDASNLSKLSMSRKKRKLYEAMLLTKQRKKDKIKLFEERKKKAQANQGS